MQLYEHISRTVVGNIPISYLEFGVYKGTSLLRWTELNTNDKSEFIGFDSFEGLPDDIETGAHRYKRGKFSTGGNPPVVEDTRVSFVKGWFQNTLPSFLYQFSTDKQIIIHCDADLYSSTMFVLCKLDSHIKQGTIVVFDDFSYMLHEFRALEDYTNAFRRQYEVLGAAGSYFYEQVAIRFVSN